MTRRQRLATQAKSAVEEDILEALSEFTDTLEKGDVGQRLTCRRIRLNLKPSRYSPTLVRETRNVLRVSQVLFARFLGISPKTVRSWEQGVNQPHSMACRFMDEIRLHPEFWTERLRDLAVARHTAT